MLSVLLGIRSRRWFLPSFFWAHSHGAVAAPLHRLSRSPVQPFVDTSDDWGQRSAQYSGSASIWHSILSNFWRRRTEVFDLCENEALRRGEGSWNVAWDARPARWLHHADSVWLFLGGMTALESEYEAEMDSKDNAEMESEVSELSDFGQCKYRVRGVVADGRCLFRAIALMSCLRNGEQVPDENRQTELADVLRARVVEELLRRRKEMQCFIEEDFDVYVKRIQQPYVWGGEPELLMAAHVLRMPISVFVKKKDTDDFIERSHYGEEYREYGQNPINVLFRDYGHYDILEAISNSGPEKKP